MGAFDWLVKNETINPAAAALRKACQDIATSMAGQAFESTPDELEAAWKVERLYYVQDFVRAYDYVRDCANQARDAALSLKASGLSADFAGLNREVAQLEADFADWGIYYNAVTQAKALNKKAIDSPDFKGWCLKVYRQAVKVAWWVPYTSCRREVTLSHMIDGLKAVGAAFVAFIKKIATAVVEIASDILAVPGKIWGLVKTAATVVLVGGIGYIGFRAYRAHQQALPSAEERDDA